MYRTGEGYSEEVAGGDGQTDGEGGAALHIGGIVLVGGGREHGEHQHHRDQELNAQGLKKRGVDCVQCCCIKGTVSRKITGVKSGINR